MDAYLYTELIFIHSLEMEERLRDLPNKRVLMFFKKIARLKLLFRRES